MAETTHISWCDATINFWIGCTEVSPACDFCYARTYGHRFGVRWGVGEARRITAHWLSKARAIERRGAELGHRPLAFSNSLSDIFDKEVDIEMLAGAFDVMRATPGVIYLLLTKRIGLVVERAAAAGGLPANAWIGATFCNQDEWNRDGGKLRWAKAETGAAIAFASFEPALGPIRRNGGWWPDWAIWGGESGAHARPPHPDWARGVRDDSADVGTPFHLKQFGEWGEEGALYPMAAGARDFPAGTVETVNRSFALAGVGNGRAAIGLRRMSREAAGRTLDGVIHDARPALGT